MPLMMTLLRHFTQQLNQICLYGDTMSIGQGQPIPQTRRCRQKNVVFGCFSTSSLSLLPSLLAQGSLSREAPREQRRSWSKSSLLSPRVHLISSSSTFKLTSLRPTSSLALGSSLSARKLQSNHWNEKILRMQCMKEKWSLRISLTINDLLLCLVDLLAHLSEDLLFHHLAMIILLDHTLHKGLNTKWKSEH